MSDNLRERALAEARSIVNQEAAEAAARAVAEEQWKADLVAAAEAACAETFGVRTSFRLRYDDPADEFSPTKAGWIATGTVEGVTVLYRYSTWDESQGRWVGARSYGSSTPHEPHTADSGTRSAWSLFPGSLTELGLAITAIENRARQEAEQEARKTARARELHPESICPRCGELIQGWPGYAKRGDTSWSEHKKRCSKRPWWRG